MLDVLKLVFKEVDFDSAIKGEGKKAGGVRVLLPSRAGGVCVCRDTAFLDKLIIFFFLFLFASIHI